MTDFIKFKQKIFARYHAYKIFLDEVEDIALSRAAKIEVPKYEPLLFELQIKDFAELIDRCIQYRKEAMELDIRAVKAFSDYELYKAIAPLDCEIDRLAVDLPIAQNDASGFKAAAAAFKVNSATKLDAGFSEQMETQASSSSLAAAAAKARIDLIDQKFEKAMAYQEAYNKRHNEAGNAHNYAQRMDRTLNLLAEDLAEAMAKADAIGRGYHMLFGEAAPPPQPVNGMVIDALISWARRLLRRIEANAQQEVEYELIVPLTQPWRGGTMESIIPKADLQAIINANTSLKQVRFELSKVFFHQSNVRLRGVGLSFGNRSDTLINGIRKSDFALNYTLRATIFTPPVTSPEGTTYRRPPVIMGAVPNYAQLRETRREISFACFNVSPIGEWTILIEAAAASDNGDKTRIENGWFNWQVIQDLKLHLRVVGRPEDKMASAFSE